VPFSAQQRGMVRKVKLLPLNAALGLLADSVEG